MNKKCTRCQRLLSIDAFYKNISRKDGLQTTCRICSSEISKNRYEKCSESHRLVTKARRKLRRAENQAKVMAIKEKYGCRLCIETDPCCLEFHHLDASTKKFALGEVTTHEFNWTTVIEEMNKCVVLCSNCHKKVHAGKKTVEVSYLCNEHFIPE